MSCCQYYAVGINKKTNKAEVFSYDRDTEYWYAHEFYTMTLSDCHMSLASAEAWLKGKEYYENFHAQVRYKMMVDTMRYYCPDVPAKDLYKCARRLVDIDPTELDDFALRTLNQKRYR